MASFVSLRRAAVLIGLAGALALPSAAQGAIPSIPNGAGGNITCTVQTGANAGQRHCSGIFTTFDGAPIDINVGFPPAPASGPDGNFPVVGLFHGWGGSKLGPTSGGWINDGYAFFSMSDRGWGLSCGGADPKRTQPVCANGYNHLMDTRFEVRDAQEIFEALADRLADGATSNEGLIDPQKIGVTGGSYGGGISLALAVLKNRKMIQDDDGTLVPWVSDGGKAMQIAAAQPDITWSDLAYALQPNGHTLDYVVDAPYLKRNRIGVMKQSFVSGLYATGQATSNYAPPGTDPDADLTTWFAAINGGEPYDTNPLSQDIVDEITKHHSSYYIDDSTAPAPLMMSNGFTDDLFPPDEAIRFYNRTRQRHPGVPFSLFFSDHGHQRGQGKVPDTTFRNRQTHAWLDYYVKGVGGEPFQGVQTLTQACGSPSLGATGMFDDPDTDLPYRASSWAAIQRGEVHFTDPDPHVIPPTINDQAGQAFDPISGPGACATAPATDQTGAASYRLEPAPASSFTVMGSATVIADINSQSATSQLAARLLDVDPATDEETLVARGLYRPEINSGSASTRQVFQLHPAGYRFAPGHIAKLELLPADQPYGRNSNGQGTVTVSNLELRIPTVNSPDGVFVEPPAQKVVPAGYELVPTGPTAYPRPGGATPLLVSLVPAFAECTSPDSTHVPPLSFGSCSSPGLESSLLTTSSVGRGSGSVRLDARVGNPSTPADEADLAIRFGATDVRNAAGGSDYTGKVILSSLLRLTDRDSAAGSATVQDFRFGVPVDCAASSDPAVGATCGITTTADTLVPGFAREGSRSVISAFSVEVLDAGADGDVGPSSACPPTCGTGDESTFLRQGVFTP
jgi:predicted acyl esterase